MRIFNCCINNSYKISSCLKKTESTTSKKRHAEQSSLPMLEIRTGASSLLWNLFFEPRHALPPSFTRGMSTFSSSLTYPMEQSGEYTLPLSLPVLPSSPILLAISRPRNSIFRLTRAGTTPVLSSLSSEARCLNSVFLFPFQLDAFANLCPRPLLYSIFCFPAFIERHTLARSLG